MKRKLSLGLAASLAASAAALSAGCANVSEVSDKEGEQAVAAVRKVIEEQQAAWNRGDIEGFMDGYAREEATTFVSADAVTRGWQTVLDRYKKSYDSREKMGTLEFTELEFRPVSPFYVAALGRWHLKGVSGDPRGRFTLLFRRTAAGWRIVHDHTSSASS
jgi:ketosteroid isomerase-like protein